MTLSMHSASVAVMTKTLGNMLGWLDKAEAHAAARKYDVNVLLGMRLAPDMLPFTKQVQIATDTAKFAAARLGGVEAPKFDDNETTVTQLRERIQRTIDFLAGVPAAGFEGSEARDIVIPRRDGSFTMKGQAYLQHYVLPNFFFHATTTYALLRHSGVELGKGDYLGALA